MYMSKGKDTMIRVDTSTREELRRLKIIPQEPYGDVIVRLIKFYKEKNRNP